MTGLRKSHARTSFMRTVLGDEATATGILKVRKKETNRRIL